jgi:hypothetical protein
MARDTLAARMAFSVLVAAWMDDHAVDRETAIYELSRLAAEMQFALNCNRGWRLRRLEQALEVMDAAIEEEYDDDGD